ncbi:dethiobiotin synthase [Aeromicrobium sp.]|uniref:dethiobiotin synthase n=1 Tax=Aeromicrobium sp. TaxID=1871063 RepID=UPI0030C4BAD4
MTDYIVITGTGTGVGKTVTTAALAVALEHGGARVAVVKPVQTGVGPGEPGDVDDVIRLTGSAAVHELARLRDPLAPESAARLRGSPLPTIAELVDRTCRIDADIVLVEGAGGVLVRLDLLGGTVLDLARALDAQVVVVTTEQLGTLNHTGLTLDRVRAEGFSPRLVLGDCAAEPGLAERCNRTDLPRLTGAPLDGLIPAGAGSLARTEFRRQAPGWFTALPAGDPPR